MDRFRVPELLVETSPLTDVLSGAGGSAGGSGGNSGVQATPGLTALADSLNRPGFAIRPLQVSRRFFLECSVTFISRARRGALPRGAAEPW